MGQTDLVTLVVTREQVHELQLAKLESLSKEQLVKGLLASKARSLFHLVKVIISQVGKEKAKELIEEVLYSSSFKSGKEAAEKAGNPTDINGYIEANTINFLGNIPAAPICEVIERTENKYVFRNTTCYQAEAVLKFRDGDPETFEVIKCLCSHDIPWLCGFNPNMTFKRTKFMLDGDDYCEFEIEQK